MDNPTFYDIISLIDKDINIDETISSFYRIFFQQFSPSGEKKVYEDFFKEIVHLKYKVMTIFRYVVFKQTFRYRSIEIRFEGVYVEGDYEMKEFGFFIDDEKFIMMSTEAEVQYIRSDFNKEISKRFSLPDVMEFFLSLILLPKYSPIKDVSQKISDILSNSDE